MNNENQWESPTPLRGNRSNLIEFPVNALPPILREMAYAIARTTSTDVSMAATAILSSVSYCFSGQFRIIGKKDHSEPLVIDSLIVAEASFKKSPVMKLVSQPYQDYVQEYNEKNKALILENQAKKKVLANKLSALEKNPDADTKEMSDLSLELGKITNADFRRIIVDDITPESLVRQLAINGTLLMMRSALPPLRYIPIIFIASAVERTLMLSDLLRKYSGWTSLLMQLKSSIRTSVCTLILAQLRLPKKCLNIRSG